MSKKTLINILLKGLKNPVKASLYVFQLISRLTTEEGKEELVVEGNV